MQCSRLLYPFAWLPTSAKHHGQKVTRLSDFESRAHPNHPPCKPLREVRPNYFDKFNTDSTFSEPSVHILIVYRSALHRFAAADFLNREWAILWDK